MEFPGTGLALDAPGGNYLVLDWLQRPLTGFFLVLDSFCNEGLLGASSEVVEEIPGNWLKLSLSGTSLI